MELVRGRPASMDGSGRMKTRFWLRRGLAFGRIGFGLGLVAAASLGVQTGGLAASSPGYSLANVGPYGGEPSIVSDSAGQLFYTTPSGGGPPLPPPHKGENPGTGAAPGPQHRGGPPWAGQTQPLFPYNPPGQE